MNYYLRSIPDPLWRRVKKRATMERIHVSVVIRKLLEWYVKNGVPGDGA